MIEPVSVPIYLDVDVSPEEYVLDVETNIVIERAEGGRGIPSGGLTGDLLGKASDADYDVCWITPADAVEQDNTRPITSAAVYTEIGNINALLATI